MTSQEQAIAVVDSVAAQLPGVWLGGRQRAVLQQAITEALDAARRETWEAAANVAAEFSKPYNIDWWGVASKKEVSAQICRDVAEKLRQQATAQADKEA